MTVTNQERSESDARKTRPPRERDREAYRLRMEEGLSYRQIAHRLGYANESGPSKAVARYLAAVETRRDAVRAETIARLDELIAAVWPRAMNGGTRAVAQARQLLAERAKLVGAYPARRITIEGLQDDIEAARQELIACGVSLPPTDALVELAEQIAGGHA